MSVKVTQGVGFQQQLVKVVEILPKNARCQNPKTHEEYYASLGQRHATAWPQVGDFWIITRNIGPWDLTVKITNPAPPVIAGLVEPASTQASIISALVSDGLASNSTVLVNWVAPTLGANWAMGDTSAAAVGVRYSIDATNRLEILGTIHSLSSSPAASVFVLPNDHIPANQHRLPCTTNSGGTHSANDIVINKTTGVVSLGTNLAASNVDVYFQVRVPMYDIS